MAVLEGLEAYKHYYYGEKVKVFTDHRALQWVKSLRDEEGGLGRWARKLSELGADIEWRAGKENYGPDGPSRNPVPPQTSQSLEHYWVVLHHLYYMLWKHWNGDGLYCAVLERQDRLKEFDLTMDWELAQDGVPIELAVADDSVKEFVFTADLPGSDRGKDFIEAQKRDRSLVQFTLTWSPIGRNFGKGHRRRNGHG